MTALVLNLQVVWTQMVNVLARLVTLESNVKIVMKDSTEMRKATA